MSRRWVLGWVLMVLLGSPSGAQTAKLVGPVPTRSALARIGLERQWMTLVPMMGIERLLEISISDNLLFAQTSLANFHTYDAETGRLLWTAHLGHRVGEVKPASVNSKLVFVTSGTKLFALDRGTGRQVWVEDLQIMPASTTACDEERVMVGLSSGLLRGFEFKVKDSTGVHLSDKAIFAWNWQTNGPLTSRPVPAGRLVAFGSHDGRLHVALSDKPTMVYRISTGGEIGAALGVYGTRTLLVPSADENVYAIDLFTASVIWTFSSGAPVMQEPLVVDDDAYVINTAGLLNAVDVHSGVHRWSTSTHGGRLISISATKIYLESHDEDLFIVDRATGRIVADTRATYQRAGVNLREFDLGPTNSLNDRLYLATKAGLVVAIREVGQVQPRLIRKPNEKPFGYIPPDGFDKTPSVAPPAEAKPEGDTPAEGDKPMPKEETEPK